MAMYKTVIVYYALEYVSCDNTVRDLAINVYHEWELLPSNVLTKH